MQLMLLQDYPSVGHINAKLRENDIIPIFASTTEFRTTYEVRVLVEGAQYTAMLGITSQACNTACKYAGILSIEEFLAACM